MEIEIPLSEFEADLPTIGEFGEITLKVEVMGVNQEAVCVLKHGAVKISKPFKEMDTEELKKKIGTVDDTEMPIQKDLKTKESD